MLEWWSCRYWCGGCSGRWSGGRVGIGGGGCWSGGRVGIGGGGCWSGDYVGIGVWLWWWLKWCSCRCWWCGG